MDGCARVAGIAGASRELLEKLIRRQVHYRRNLLRLCWQESELDNGGSDRLFDALALHGDAVISRGREPTADDGPAPGHGALRMP